LPTAATPTLQGTSYEELCTEVDLADLHRAGRDAIAHVAPAATLQPATPVDHAHIVGTEPGPWHGPPAATRARYPETWWTEPFRSPPIYAALLHEVLCFGGLPPREHSVGHTLLVGDRHVVPDSHLVRGASRVLPPPLAAGLEGLDGPASSADPEGAGGSDSPAGRDSATPDGRDGTWADIAADTAGLATQPGLYYFAGAAWGQWGHFLLEGLSRWWLLGRLPASVRAELRFVLYNEQPLARWQLELLAGLGVSPERLVLLTRPMRFERLLVPSIAYNIHCEASPVQGETWERIGRACDCGESPERVYLSRSRYTRTRSLLNEAEVERRFAAHGFVVLHPQALSVTDQVAIIRDARLIAGGVGSAMYTSAFARPGASTLIIAPRYFAFRDDQLIAHLRGHRLAYVMCERGSNPREPRLADYAVDLDVLDAALGHWVEQAQGSL
jgi:hypothetical protein